MSSLEQFENVLSKLRAFKKQPLIWIAGNLNAPYINWESQSLFEGSPYPSTHEKLLDILMNHALTQMVLVPTRGSNILDLCIYYQFPIFNHFRLWLIQSRESVTTKLLQSNQLCIFLSQSKSLDLYYATIKLTGTPYPVNLKICNLFSTTLILIMLILKRSGLCFVTNSPIW